MNFYPISQLEKHWPAQESNPYFFEKLGTGILSVSQGDGFSEAIAVMCILCEAAGCLEEVTLAGSFVQVTLTSTLRLKLLAKPLVFRQLRNLLGAEVSIAYRSDIEPPIYLAVRSINRTRSQSCQAVKHIIPRGDDIGFAFWQRRAR
jgi:hypothetical protein